MGLGTLGFLKGASRTAIDSITAREEAEAEIKKQKQLTKFRMDAEQALAMKKVVSTTREVGADGKIKLVGRNEDMQVIPGKERLETSDETEAFNRGLKKEQLSIDSAEANIRDVNDQIRSRGVGDAREARSTDAYIANLRRSAKDGGDKDTQTDADRAKELRYRHQALVDKAVESKNISGPALALGSIEIIKNSRTGEEAETSFLQWLNDYTRGKKQTANRTNTYPRKP